MQRAIIVILLHLTRGQEIEIQNLKTNPGLLPLKMGQAKIKTSTHDFIHYYDLQPIHEEIFAIESQYDAVSTAIRNGLSDPYFFNLQNFDQGLKYQLKTAKEKLQTLYPLSRSKRGLIDGLGSVIKAISGNLDQEDARKYENAIASLENNQRNIISHVNQHISLNTRRMKSYNETISLLTHNQDTISIEVKRIETDLNRLVFDFNHYLETRNVLDQINLILQVILQTLNDLEMAVSLARINTVHNSVLKSEDLSWIVRTLLTYHSENQLLYNQEDDIHKYYDVTKIDAYYTDHKIVFILHVPLIFPDTFTYFHLFPIPTQNSTIIIPPTPYLTVSPYLYQYLNLPCERIGLDYLCEENFLQDTGRSPDCVTQMLEITDEEARCEHVPVSMNATLILEMSEAHYIGIFPQATKISTHCSSTKVMVLEGVHLIKLPPGCEFKTNNEAFINSKSVISDEPLTLPNIKTAHINSSLKFKPLKLDKIPLDKLQHLTLEEERLQLIPEETRQSDNSHFWMTPFTFQSPSSFYT
ncbi:uncharacterized protein [Leptinotarsa decemlineata]|uniref:uncharacterized protein n=1 Tax=Leptinotarsa decemlineata TaxID=7539 RepID=UPI003D305EC0